MQFIRQFFTLRQLHDLLTRDGFGKHRRHEVNEDCKQNNRDDRELLTHKARKQQIYGVRDRAHNDRSKERKKREKQEIGISAVRGGTIVGEHEVIFAGTDEVIELKHTAYSKTVFGKGAIEAAKYLAGKPAGRYDMSDVIQL